MSSLEHVTIAELHGILSSLDLPPDTRLTITFEDSPTAIKALKRQRAIEAMKKLKGSGTGNLVTVLLKEREKDGLL
jgi:hypothetical protein